MIIIVISKRSLKNPFITFITKDSQNLYNIYIYTKMDICRLTRIFFLFVCLCVCLFVCSCACTPSAWRLNCHCERVLRHFCTLIHLNVYLHPSFVYGCQCYYEYKQDVLTWGKIHHTRRIYHQQWPHIQFRRQQRWHQRRMPERLSTSPVGHRG